MRKELNEEEELLEPTLAPKLYLIVHPIRGNYNLNATRLKAMFHRPVESTGESSLNISSLEVESASNDKYLQLLLMAQTN